jgi:hypothetical protein
MELAQLTQLASSLNDFIIAVNKMSFLCENLMKEVIKTLNHLDELEADAEKLKPVVMECKALLQKTQFTANNLVHRLKTYLQFGDLSLRHKRMILRTAREGDLSALNNYLHQLREYWRQCEECYQKFNDNKVMVSDRATSSMSTASEGKNVAARYGKTYNTLGYLASSFVSTVRNSYVSKKLTNAIDEASSTLGLVVSGTASSFGSVIEKLGEHASNVGEQYIKIREKFNDISEDFRRLQVMVADLDLNMTRITGIIEGVSYNSGIVTADYNSMESALHILVDSIRSARSMIEPPKNNENNVCFLTFLVPLFFLGLVFILSRHEYL